MSGMYMPISDLVMRFPNSTRASIIVVSAVSCTVSYHVSRTRADVELHNRHPRHCFLLACTSTSQPCLDLLVDPSTTASKTTLNHGQTSIRLGSIGGIRFMILRLCKNTLASWRHMLSLMCLDSKVVWP
jgi:hypothetical protein